MRNRMWGGRFKKKTNAAFEYFSSSLSEDYKLAACDIRASKVHCRMLKRTGLLTAAQCNRIVRALDQIGKKLAKCDTDFSLRKYEDVHSFLEHQLIQRVGGDGKRIHAARSRNDQVNQATRMYCKDAVRNLIRSTSELQLSIWRQANRHKSVVVAGFTHLQKAQPILLAHQFLSYVESLERMKSQLNDVLKRIDVLTLGSGALAGTSLRIDREWVRRELGFAEMSANSLDAVGSRDFLAELTFILALMGVQLSRLSEDFLIGQLEEIRWFEIPEELCTGSSMMPQKRNPDFLELVRGASSILIGNAVAVLTLLKGLPGSYNRDLQWDKRPLFSSVEIMTQILYLYRVFFDRLKVNRLRTEAGLSADGLYATDLAEYLVSQGVPFREAHEKVGKLMASLDQRGIALKEAPPALLKKILGVKIDGIRQRLCTPEGSVMGKKGFGSTHPKFIQKQLDRWRKKLSHASL